MNGKAMGIGAITRAVRDAVRESERAPGPSGCAWVKVAGVEGLEAQRSYVRHFRGISKQVRLRGPFGRSETLAVGVETFAAVVAKAGGTIAGMRMNGDPATACDWCDAKAVGLVSTQVFCEGCAVRQIANLASMGRTYGRELERFHGPSQRAA